MGLLKDLVTGRLTESPAQMMERTRSEDRRYFIGLRDRGVITQEQFELEVAFNEKSHDIGWMLFNGEISQSQADGEIRALMDWNSWEMTVGLMGRGIEPVMGLVPPSARR